LTDQKISNISVVIPTLNEETTLGHLLTTLLEHLDVEVIVADGGSSDQTLAIADYYGVKAVSSEPGRGKQQNLGAGLATGDILLFLHSDTFLPDDFPHHIHATLGRPATVAGAFRLKINAPGSGYRLIEWGVYQRSKLLQLIYGDQAIFVRKKTFLKAGGFPEQTFLEDMELIRRLKKLGRIRLAPAAVTTSARRWHHNGLVRTTLLNQCILLGYLAGVNHDTLGRFYYRNRPTPHP
jgi:rSAM/selenodomain-associated transferase 2